MGNKSSSNTNITSVTETNQTNQTFQYDQRVAAADQGIAIAPGVHDVTINTLPPEIGVGLVDLLFNAESRLAQVQTERVQSANNTAAAAVTESQQTQLDSDKTVKIMLIGIVAVAAIVLMMK